MKINSSGANLSNWIELFCNLSGVERDIEYQSELWISQIQSMQIIELTREEIGYFKIDQEEEIDPDSTKKDVTR